VRGFGNCKDSTLVSDIAAIDVRPRNMRGMFHMMINEMGDGIIRAAVAEDVIEDIEVCPVRGKD
jgi:hypothetical protein